MKNPYLYSYLPLFTIILFSLSFGIFAVNQLLPFLSSIGVYSGMREFLSDIELRVFLLIILSLCFFMLFSALKLIGQTIHEVGMLFFSKDKIGETISVARGGYVIFFFGSLLSVIGIQSVSILMAIFAITVFIYFIYTIYKMSKFMTMVGMLGLIIFEILFWSIFVSLLLYILLKLYNGVLASLPFAN
ncbi:Membrane protein YufK OS=Ureibacillus acetophenoni OX=614649 GN=SAMN05877842_109129 PE=4 SV=1 [Ureibacillus acetophenoni]|uniref:DUF5366 family protein n=1 Tax=Ureibacillus sp. MALMAid1270 TaxID=3411629 RepID=UPI003BA3FC77